MKNKIIGMLIITAILAASICYFLQPISFKDNALTDALKMLGYLFVISLIMERAIEVFLSTWRGGEADLKDLEIQKLTGQLSELTDANEETGKIDNIRSDLESLKKERTKYRIKSRAIALWTGLICGIIVAGIGIHTLEAMVDIKKIVYPPQLIAFKTIDIVLTGSVLAGGSEAINKLMKVYTTFMQTTADKAKG